MKSALIVIADPALRLRWLRMLGRHGWSVDAVGGLDGARAALDRAPRDVALVDWQIEGGLGSLLVTTIKSHPAWQSVPAVILQDGATIPAAAPAEATAADDILPLALPGDAALAKLERWVPDRTPRVEAPWPVGWDERLRPLRGLRPGGSRFPGASVSPDWPAGPFDPFAPGRGASRRPGVSGR